MKSVTTRHHEILPTSRRFEHSRFSRRLVCGLQLAWLRYRRWCAARRAIRQLRELDAYLLDDIGIERQQITEVVHAGKGLTASPGQSFAPPLPSNPCGSLAA